MKKKMKCAACGRKHKASHEKRCKTGKKYNPDCKTYEDFDREAYYKVLADAKQKKEAEAKAKEEEAAKIKAEAEAKVKAEAEEKIKAEAEAKAKEEADVKAKAEAEAKAKEEAKEAKVKAKEEAKEAKVKAKEEAKTKFESEAKAKTEAEEKAKMDAEAKATAEAKEAEIKRVSDLNAKNETCRACVVDCTVRNNGCLLPTGGCKGLMLAEDKARMEAEIKRVEEINAKVEAEAVATGGFDKGVFNVVTGVPTRGMGEAITPVEVEQSASIPSMAEQAQENTTAKV